MTSTLPITTTISQISKAAFVQELNNHLAAHEKITLPINQPLEPFNQQDLVNLVRTRPDACGLMTALYTKATEPHKIPKEQYGDWHVQLTKAGWVVKIDSFAQLQNLSASQIAAAKEFHAAMFEVQGYSLIQLSDQAACEMEQFHDDNKGNIFISSKEIKLVDNCKEPIKKLGRIILDMHPLTTGAKNYDAQIYTQSSYTVDYRVDKESSFPQGEHTDPSYALALTNLAGAGTLLFPPQIFEILRKSDFVSGGSGEGYDLSFRGLDQGLTQAQKNSEVPATPPHTILYLANTTPHAVPIYGIDRKLAIYGCEARSNDYDIRRAARDQTFAIYGHDPEVAKKRAKEKAKAEAEAEARRQQERMWSQGNYGRYGKYDGYDRYGSSSYF